MEGDYQRCSGEEIRKDPRQLKIERQRRYRQRKRDSRQGLEAAAAQSAEEVRRLRIENSELSVRGQVLEKLEGCVRGALSALGIGHPTTEPSNGSAAQRDGDGDANGIFLDRAAVAMQLFGAEEPSKDLMMRVVNWPIETLASVDEFVFQHNAPLYQQLCICPDDEAAQQQLTTFFRRRRLIILRFMQARPGEFIAMAELRILPPAPGGGVNAKLFGLSQALKLQPSQRARLLAAWEQYKEVTLEARLSCRLALHQAVTGLGGAEGVAVCSMRAANAFLGGMQNVAKLQALPAVEGSALMNLFSIFADTMTASQRAFVLNACCPYAPDLLQANVVLFESDWGEACTAGCLLETP